MTKRVLYFTGPRLVEVREHSVPDPDDDEVLVRTERSGDSSGTELLVYRGEISPEVATDETIEALDGTFSYPPQYGYAAVGRVAEVGDAVDDDLLSEFPLANHVTVDRDGNRRSLSESLGADRSIAPEDLDAVVGNRADLTFELSRNPDALDDAIDVTGYAGGSSSGRGTARRTSR